MEQRLVRMRAGKRRHNAEPPPSLPIPMAPVAHWNPPAPPLGVRAVRLYGCAPGVEDAPAPYPGEEVWCINNPWAQRRQRGPRVLTEWTHWFNFHTFRHQVLCYPRGVAYLMRKDGTRPVYMQEVNKDIPGSVTFPKDALLKYFGHRYFTCSAAWQMAFAIYIGMQWMEIWGHRMSAAGEHAGQRAGFLFWVGEARRRGIEVVVPKGFIGHPEGDGHPTTLIEDPRQYRGYLYGYEPHTNAYKESF